MRIAGTRRLPWFIALELALVVVLAAGVLRAGTAFFVCTQMAVATSQPCCAAHDAEDTDCSAIDHAPCCVRDHVRALPAATHDGTSADVPDARLVAALAREPAVDAALEVVNAPATFSRAGPPPRRERAARMMVFLL